MRTANVANNSMKAIGYNLQTLANAQRHILKQTFRKRIYNFYLFRTTYTPLFLYQFFVVLRTL
jgi:hypothetical protein